MQVNRDTDFANYAISAYAEGQITVAIPPRFDTNPSPPGNEELEPHRPGSMRREVLYRSLIIMPDKLITDWPPQTCEELSRPHFDLLAEQPVEIVLFGTGARLQWPEPELLTALKDRRIGVEIMDTGSACRTYNFLMTDRRRVAAALLMI